MASNWRDIIRASAVAAPMFLVLGMAACTSKPAQPSQAAPPKSDGGQSDKVNLDDIFPPGRGRELVLNNCTGCHTFVPIVVLQLTKEAWEHNQRIHRERVPSMSDADFQALYDYLEASFNPNRPVPKLPKSLLETWTSY